MAARTAFLAFVLDELAELPELEARRLFGGHGLYSDAAIFGIVYKDRLYFKITDATRPRYEERDMGPFQPKPKTCLKSYYEVPLEVIEDHAELLDWAREAIAQR